MSIQETRKRERAFEEFARRVTDALGDAIPEIVLYGSTAREEATERSNVDVMIVMDGLDDRDKRETVFAISFDVCLDYGVDIEPNLQSKERFESRQDHPLIRRRVNEGRFYG